MEDRKQALLERIKRDRGVVALYMKILAREDPDYLEHWHNTFMHVMQGRQALPRKFKELIVVAANAATLFEEGVKFHIRSALKFGATKDEVIEALEAAALPGGIHALTTGLLALEEVLQELAARQKPAT